MLVLSRKTNESIIINDQIAIEILQIKGNQIRIGIVAPRDVAIRRGELTPWSQLTRVSEVKSDVASALAAVG